MRYKKTALYHRKGGGIFSSLINIGKKLLPKVISIGRKALPMAKKGLEFYGKNQKTIHEVANQINQNVVPERYRKKINSGINTIGSNYTRNKTDINKYIDYADKNINSEEVDKFIKANPPKEGGRYRGRGFLTSEEGGAIPESIYLNTIQQREKLDNIIKPKNKSKKISPQKRLLQLIKK